MDKTIVEYIRFELRNYPSYKNLHTNFAISDLLTYKQQLWRTLLIQGIETALACMPPYLRRYVEVRYFQKSGYTKAGAAMRLNIGERTVSNWDKQVISIVAEHIGILNTFGRNS